MLKRKINIKRRKTDKKMKGFVTLQECKGIVGEISVGTELKRAEL